MEMINSPQGGDRPVLILDVDGVLLVTDEEIPKRCPEGYEIGPAGSPYEFYNPRHGEWIQELLTDVDFFWLTSHDEQTHEDIGRPLGLPEVPYLSHRNFEHEQWREENEKSFDVDAMSNNLNQARRTAIDTFLKRRIIIWIDDSLTPKDFQWGMERGYKGTPSLLMKPDPAEGLQYAHIDRAKAWLGHLAALP